MKSATLSASAAVPPPPALMVWALLVVGAASLGGGLVGLLIGSAIGWLLPGHYRAVFARGAEPSFEPLQVGAGLGLTQGLMAGAAIGLVVVALYFWLRIRALAAASPTH